MNVPAPIPILRLVSVFLCWALVAFQARALNVDNATRIASLIDPVKLATLAARGANPRVQKAVYWLATARNEGETPGKVMDRAVALAGYGNTAAAKLTKEALLRNLDIADSLDLIVLGLPLRATFDLFYGESPHPAKDFLDVGATI